MSTEQQVVSSGSVETENVGNDQIETSVDPVAEQPAEEEVKPEKKEDPPLWDRSILKQPKLNEFLKMQSVPLDSDPSVRRSPRVDDTHLFGTLKEGVYTIHDMFMHGYGINHDAPCAGWRPSPTDPYKWVSYQDVYEMACSVGSGLIEKGAKASHEQFIGIYAKNSLPWLVFDRACAAYSMVSVPLYDSLGPEALTHIVNHCELSILLVDTNNNAKKLLNDKKSGNTNSIRLLILVEPADDELTSLCEEMNVESLTFEELQEAGKKCLHLFVPPTPDDLYTISYTSGTTGTPKGVMHTHKNGVAIASAFLVNSGDYFYNLSSEDVHLSYLPLAHVFERYMECGILMHGAKIGFFFGDPKRLMDDAAALKPTVFPLVPRVLNRIYSKVMAAVGQSGFKRYVFDFCLRRKLNALKNGEVVNNSFWDKILFHKFQSVVGGRVRLSLTAAAPVSPEVLNVVRCVLGIPILEGYGQTESTSGFTTTLYGDFAGGNVGTILPNMLVKLVDVPEKEYYAKNNQGEICCKGLSVFKGYFKDEQKTKETIDTDGWLHTGDIGEWLPNGSLKIIDRRKNIFKLSQGEYIAPEKIEQIYELCEIVGQVFVHGYSLKSSIVGVVVPSEEALPGWCKMKGIDTEGKPFAEICQIKEFAEGILDDMNKKGRQMGLKSFELVKKIHVSSEIFTIENELLTPTLKSRRPRIEKRYKAEIDEMYSALD